MCVALHPFPLCTFMAQCLDTVSPCMTLSDIEWKVGGYCVGDGLLLFLTSFFSSVESTALRLITGLGSAEVQPQLSRFLSEPKTLVSAESEELNRALVLTLARSMHVTGTGKREDMNSCVLEILTVVKMNQDFLLFMLLICCVGTSRKSQGASHIC